MYTIEEFDKQKTKVFKYIIYKKRTEQEIRNKYRTTIQEDMLEDIIEYLKEAKYIDDNDFIAKGKDKKLIEENIEKNYEELKEYENRCIEKIKNKKSNTNTEEEINQYLYRKGYKCD